MSSGYIRLDFNFCNLPIARARTDSVRWERGYAVSVAKLPHCTVTLPSDKPVSWPGGWDTFVLFAVLRYAYLMRDPELVFHEHSQLVNRMQLDANSDSGTEMGYLFNALTRWTYTHLTWPRFYHNRQSHRLLHMMPPLTVEWTKKFVRIVLADEWFDRFVMNIHKPLHFCWPLPRYVAAQNAVLSLMSWPLRYPTGSGIRRTLVFKSHKQFAAHVGCITPPHEVRRVVNYLDEWLRKHEGKVEQLVLLHETAHGPWTERLRKTMAVDRRLEPTAMAITVKLPLLMADARHRATYSEYLARQEKLQR